MTWKKLGVDAAIVLSVSLGAVSAFAEPENEAEVSENQTEQQKAFDPAKVEDKAAG